MSDLLYELREKAKAEGNPVLRDKSFELLKETVTKRKPQKILEIGVNVGLSGIAMLLCSENASLTGIEIDETAKEKAQENYKLFGVEKRAKIFLGDASEIIPLLTGEYDFIFLDGPKAHYIYMLNDCIRLLKKGGLLVADNVLYKGMTADDAHVIRRKITIVKRLRRFISAQLQRDELRTVVLPLGDGVTVAVKM